MSGILQMLQQQRPQAQPTSAQTLTQMGAPQSYLQALRNAWQRFGVPLQQQGAGALSPVVPRPVDPNRALGNPPAGPGLTPPPPTFLQRLMRGGVHGALNPSSIRIDFHKPEPIEPPEQ